jgi:hypothetical protein
VPDLDKKWGPSQLLRHLPPPAAHPLGDDDGWNRCSMGMRETPSALEGLGWARGGGGCRASAWYCMLKDFALTVCMSRHFWSGCMHGIPCGSSVGFQVLEARHSHIKWCFSSSSCVCVRACVCVCMCVCVFLNFSPRPGKASNVIHSLNESSGSGQHLLFQSSVGSMPLVHWDQLLDNSEKKVLFCICIHVFAVAAAAGKCAGY